MFAVDHIVFIIQFENFKVVNQFWLDALIYGFFFQPLLRSYWFVELYWTLQEENKSSGTVLSGGVEKVSSDQNPTSANFSVGALHERKILLPKDSIIAFEKVPLRKLCSK